MIDKELLDDEESLIVEMTDADGNVYYYVEEMIIPVGNEKFALLVAAEPEEHEHGEDCDCCDDDVIIAKVILNEQGEEEYIEPTDEEFEAVQAAYEKLMDDLE